VTLSMPGYIEKMLKRFRLDYLHPSHRPSRTPGKYTIPVYRCIQHVEIDDSPSLSPSQKSELQAIVGTILYYARAVDPTLLPIANELASQQATPTTKVLTAANRPLSYCAGHMENSITYNACDMILFGDVDASYLSRSHDRYVAGDVYFLGDRHKPLKINGSIHVFSSPPSSLALAKSNTRALNTQVS
jgi:hypothetical protein